MAKFLNYCRINAIVVPVLYILLYSGIGETQETALPWVNGVDVMTTPDVTMIAGPLAVPVKLNRINKTRKAVNSKPKLPVFDATGKVHGKILNPKDFDNFSKVELQILHKDLSKSVNQRIRKNKELGYDRAHWVRQSDEQNLIKQLEKYFDTNK